MSRIKTTESNLYKRKGRPFWHFKYRGKDGKLHPVSTGKTLKYEAAKVMQTFLADQEKKAVSVTLSEWAAPFFIRGKCPREERLKQEGKAVSVHHQKNQRAWLEKHILPDPIASCFLHEITRGDMIDFFSRLLKKLGDRKNTFEKVKETFKVIMNEAYFREIILRNPFLGIGRMKYQKRKIGIFTLAELNRLFFQEPSPWRDIQARTCFLIAASLGRRRGEILALQGKHIDFENGIIKIYQAWKRGEGIGTTKTGIKLDLPIPEILRIALIELKADALDSSPESFLFSLDGKKAFGGTWWHNQFIDAMQAAGYDYKTRGLKPHSFRHTLNTILRARMKDPSLVRSFIGWTNKETQEGYTHFQSEHLLEVAGAVDDMFGKKEGD